MPYFGSLAELPYETLQPDSWTPAPDPAVIVRSDCVEVRRIHLFFNLDLESDAPRTLWENGDYRVDRDALHRLLSARLIFA